MSYYIGLDVGTSGVKAMLVSEDEIIDVITLDYPISFPQESYAEQNPENWLDRCLQAIERLGAQIAPDTVDAISFSGQMHGLVMLDKNDNVIRPAILWNDGRSVKEVDYLNNTVSEEYLVSKTGNIAFAGFTAPKVLWVYNNEPENFARAVKICLPKDYVAYKLSGVFATDTSDASGTLYFDTEKRDWSDDMLELIHINRGMLPRVFESSETIGKIKEEYTSLPGISSDTLIVIGAGDNAASAIGTGTVNNGACNISLGTSGTVFVCTDEYSQPASHAIHSFCSANGKYHYLACTLTAASSQKWWIEDILKGGYDNGSEIYFGKSKVMFLPYLMGERSPVNDTQVRGMFTNLSMNTQRDEMTAAVLEGVAFSLRENIDIIRKTGVEITESGICGGGTKNRFWLKLTATILGINLIIPENEHGGVLGACILAAKGAGRDISSAFTGRREVIYPDSEKIPFYDEKYAKYLKLYPLAKQL